ncbi:MAG TPA: thiamine phosphate synthase [Allosphingosinicella sp.]|nr:thiamine phosphate synthase [Allosphingosinicella sp.]
MTHRQRLPTRWLMTDERLGARLSNAIARLPDGGGIVFRHYGLVPAQRRTLFDRAKAAARDRGLMILLAGPAQEAQAWGADGSHGRGGGAGLRTAPAHDLAEIRAAEQAGAALVFLSPVFETRSHPGAATLGPERFARLAAQTTLPVVALGGMTEDRFTLLNGAYGWAGIDAWNSSPS